MVIRVITRCLAGLYGALYGRQEVLPPGVTQRLLQVPGKPELDILPRQRLRQRVQPLLHLPDQFPIHGSLLLDAENRVSPFVFLIEVIFFPFDFEFQKF
jgi:hypothetical protein